MSTILLLPTGRIKITGPILLQPNVSLPGQRPGSSYLSTNVRSAAERGAGLATGAEVQCEIRDLGILINDNVSTGIGLVQTAGASILGDIRHVIDNVVVVGGACAVYTTGSTECRYTTVAAYRQYPDNGLAAVYIGGTDSMIDRITIAQAQYSFAVQGAAGGSGLRLGTANTRVVDCKVFGGNATVNRTMASAIRFIGQRNQLIGIEVQDWAGGWAIADDQGNDLWTAVICDFCQGVGVQGPSAAGISRRRAMRQQGRRVHNAVRHISVPRRHLRHRYRSPDRDRGNSRSISWRYAAAGGRVRITGRGGSIAAAYAATITP